MAEPLRGWEIYPHSRPVMSELRSSSSDPGGVRSS